MIRTCVTPKLRLPKNWHLSLAKTPSALKLNGLTTAYCAIGSPSP